MNQRVEKLCATVLGIGYLPIAPGTWASLAAVLTWYLLHLQIEFSPEIQFAAIASGIFVGLWSSIRLEKLWGKDPSQIVIDEWAGMWITCFLVAPGWKELALALIVFRILDIWKPFFIRRAEKLKGGWGVMMDDIIAGVMGNLIVRIIIWML